MIEARLCRPPFPGSRGEGQEPPHSLPHFQIVAIRQSYVNGASTDSEAHHHLAVACNANERVAQRREYDISIARDLCAHGAALRVQAVCLKVLTYGINRRA